LRHKDVEQAFAECSRVLSAIGPMVIHQLFATALMEPKEALRIYANSVRLRRAKPELIDELGAAAYRALYSNALWSIYQMIGKLEARVFVLRRAES
jgi:hypothetical protein